MKIYVGTLFSGENEFEQCKKAINSQRYNDFDHVVFSYLPNKEAHFKLYTDFLSKKEYDILVKVDADTVLIDNRAFDRIVSIFNSNPRLQHVNFMLWDFYTMRRIRGQSSNRNGFWISDNNNNVFVDRVIKYQSKDELYQNEIIGIHSPNPSFYQAFHFGFHRQLKKQHYLILHLFKAFIVSFNLKRAYALCGAMAVITGQLSSKNNDIYDDRSIQYMFQRTTAKPRTILYPYILFFFIWHFIKLGILKLMGKVNNAMG